MQQERKIGVQNQIMTVIQKQHTKWLIWVLRDVTRFGREVGIDQISERPVFVLKRLRHLTPWLNCKCQHSRCLRIVCSHKISYLPRTNLATWPDSRKLIVLVSNNSKRNNNNIDSSSNNDSKIRSSNYSSSNKKENPTTASATITTVTTTTTPATATTATTSFASRTT